MAIGTKVLFDEAAVSLKRIQEFDVQQLNGPSSINSIELINRQRNGSKAKPHQVRQVRAITLQYKLGAEE